MSALTAILHAPLKATATAPTTTPAAAPAPPSASDLQRAQAARVKAYKDALARLNPAWSLLPTAPYPPSGDTTNFPRTGSPGLIVRRDSVNAAQRAEPGKVTQALNQQAIARRPKLNAYFLVGAACLTAYLVLR